MKRHTMIHETTKKFMEGFRYDAHPMGILIATVAALSTFYPEARAVHDPALRKLQILRLIGKIPTLAAYAYRQVWDCRTFIPTTSWITPRTS